MRVQPAEQPDQLRTGKKQHQNAHCRIVVVIAVLLITLVIVALCAYDLFLHLSGMFHYQQF